VLASLLCAGSVAAAGLPPVPDAPPESVKGVGPDRSFLVSGGILWGAQPDPFLKQVYDIANPFSMDLHVTFLFGERFGLGVGGAFHNRTGVGVAPSDGTPPVVMIWEVPLYLEGMLRLLVWKSQPVVPYVRGGLDAMLWRENFFISGTKHELRGIKWGAHIAGGAQFRLPFPEINQPGRLIGDPVLDDIYLYIEGWARSASNFGSSPLDLSAGGLAVGITLLL
jgi:hypothetical protein